MCVNNSVCAHFLYSLLNTKEKQSKEKRTEAQHGSRSADFLFISDATAVREHLCLPKRAPPRPATEAPSRGTVCRNFPQRTTGRESLPAATRPSVRETATAGMCGRTESSVPPTCAPRCGRFSPPRTATPDEASCPDRIVRLHAPECFPYYAS